MSEIVKTSIIIVAALATLFGISYLERRRFRKKAQAEQNATLKRMEAEQIRIMNRLQHDHDVEVARLASLQNMQAMAEPLPVQVNQFIYNQSDWVN